MVQPPNCCLCGRQAKPANIPRKLTQCFGGVSAEELGQLIQRRMFPHGTVLCSKGGPTRQCYYEARDALRAPSAALRDALPAAPADPPAEAPLRIPPSPSSPSPSPPSPPPPLHRPATRCDPLTAERIRRSALHDKSPAATARALARVGDDKQAHCLPAFLGAPPPPSSDGDAVGDAVGGDSGSAAGASLAARPAGTRFERMLDPARWRRGIHKRWSVKGALRTAELVRFEDVPWLTVAASFCGDDDGLFADRPFRADELVVRFGEGRVLEQQQAGSHVVRRTKHGPWLDFTDALAGKIQWSDRPCAVARGFDGVYALRDIADGEELTIAYRWARAPA